MGLLGDIAVVVVVVVIGIVVVVSRVLDVGMVVVEDNEFVEDNDGSLESTLFGRAIPNREASIWNCLTSCFDLSGSISGLWLLLLLLLVV